MAAERQSLVGAIEATDPLGAVSRAVRTPSRGDHDFQAITGAVPADSLLEGSPAALFRLEASRDFESEKLTAFDAGYRTSLYDAVLVDIAVFYSRYDDHLTIEPVPGLPLVEGDQDSPYWVIPVNTANLSEARTYGVETSVEWVVKDWRLRAIYSYLEVNIDLAEGSLDQSSQGFDGDSPNHQLGVRVMSRLPAGIQLFTAGRYVGALPRPGIDSYVEADVRLSAPRWRGNRVLRDRPQSTFQQPSRGGIEHGWCCSC